MSSIEIGVEEITAAIGMRGTGKTTLAEHIADAQPSEVSIAAWDPKGVWPDKYSYRPREFSLEELNRFFGWVIQAAPCRVFLEEIEQLLKSGIDLPPNVRRATMMGRESGISYHVDARMPRKVHKGILDEADHYFLFKLSGAKQDYIVRKFLGRRHRDQLATMDTWTKDPRDGGGRFFHLYEGHLEACQPLDV